jgi:hypothetical protein
MTEAETATLVRDVLHDLGYKAQMIDDDSVGSAASGLRFYVQSYGDSLQFRCGINLESKDGGWLEFVNSFNKQMRYVKVYLDEETDLVAETDLWLDPDGSNHANRFRQALELWELSLAALKEQLRENATLATHTG